MAIVKTKIIAITDLHVDSLDNYYIWSNFIKEISNKDFDILLITGDISESIDSYKNLLYKLSGLCSKIIIVLGNHDIWVQYDDQYYSNIKDSWEKYYIKNDIANEIGIISLDSKPYIVNNIGFVGNIGWYDYSFRDKSIDIKYPLADTLYKIKQFPNGLGKWNDGIYAKWGMTDKQVTKYFADKLEEDINSIEDKCESICILMHHIPIQSMIIKKNEEWNMGNAFMGSSIFGNIINKYKKIKHVFCGHSHGYFDEIINGVRYINAGVDFMYHRYVEVDICQ